MKPVLFLLLPACLLIGTNLNAVAQANQPTAIRTLVPSAFVMVGGTSTGVGSYSRSSFSNGGKNLTLTAGVDVGFHSFGNYMLAAEVRGSYPLNSGNIVAEKDILGGARLSYESGRLIRPYVDGLFGRGQMTYQNGGYAVGNLLYAQTASNIYGAGGGVELDIATRISLKADVQAQHWNTPVLDSGSTWSGRVSVGAAYRFGAGQGPR
ncbi:hypothetical protein [Terriglobus sp. ADX1]|uniref:hypothetical protein n=1 Tax=Terriglobus sp. ADX1 TaxID=2794063 RepID=UPI002FE5E2B1